MFLLLVLAFAAPVVIVRYYQEEIKTKVLTQLNLAFKGHTTLNGLHVSPFRNFPYVSIDLEGLTFYADANDTTSAIYHFDDAYLGFDVLALFKGNFDVKKVALSGGFLHVVTYADGRINLMEAKNMYDETPQEADTSDFHFMIDSILLQDILLTHNNLEGDKYTSLNIAQSNAQIRMAEDGLHFRLDLKAILEEYRTGKTVMFKNKHIELHNDLSYDFGKEHLLIRPGKVNLESGTLNFEGTINFKDDVNLDLRFDGQKKSFDLFISLAPEVVIDAMSKFTTRGDVYLKGSITGKSLHQNPHVEVEMGCANTFFMDRRTQKDVIKDLQFKGFFNTGKDNTLATSSFYLESLYGAPQNSVMRGMFRVENFEKPLINMDFHADIDLHYLPEFFPVTGLKKSSGKVKMDITLKEFVTADSVLVVASQLQEGTSSHIDFKDVNLWLNKYPHPIKNISGSILLNGDQIKAKNLSAKILNNDLSLSFSMEDLLHFIHGDDAPLAFYFETEAKRFKPNEVLPKAWLPKADSNSVNIWDDELRNFHFAVDVRSRTKAFETYKYLPTLAIDFHDFRFESKKYPNKVHEIKGKLELSDQGVQLNQMVVHIGESKIIGMAKVWPVAPLFDSTNSDWISYQMDLQTPYIDIKQLAQYDGKYINDAIDREVLKKAILKAHGKYSPASKTDKGVNFEMDIDKLYFILNDLPPFEKVSGRITTDNEGSVHIHNFKASLGKSDFNIHLDLFHYLDGDIKNKNIKGQLKTNWLDTDELSAYTQPAENTHKNSKPQKDTDNPHTKAFNLFEFPFPDMQLDVDITHLRHHKYVIDNFKGRLRTTANHYIHVDSLKMDAADGQFVIHGYFNGADPKNIYLTSYVRLNKVNLNKLLYKFDNFGQDFMVSDNLRGIVTGFVNSTAHMYPDLTVDLKKTTAHAEATVTNGRLIKFAPMHAMADMMGDKDLDDIHFGEMSNTFDIKDGYISFPAMKLASSIGYMYLSGKQNFDEDMRMDYEIKLPLSLVKQASWNMLKAKVFGKRKAKADESTTTATIPDDEELVDEEKVIIDGQKGIIRKYITVRMEGTSENLKINMGKKKRG